MALRVGIIGAGGRMGAALLQAIRESGDMTLAAAVDRPDSSSIGSELAAGATGVQVVSDLQRALQGLDVAIDFSRADGAGAHASACAAAGVPLLIGTTGLGEDALTQIQSAAARIPVLVSANTSLGLNVLLELVRQAAESLPADFDIEVFEAHHRHKLDAPSGTALVLAEAAAAGRGFRLQRPAGITGSRQGAREPGQIGFSVVRGGDVVGEHEVRLIGSGEQLKLMHVATDRAVFARGALAAARWLAGQPPGRYQMSDFLFNKQ